ncbi:MAG: aminopeptidase [Bacteroidota bacterium]
MELLEKLCGIHAPSGEEFRLKDFLLEYIEKEKPNWQVCPEIIHGNDYMDSLILVFGKPETVAYCHMDSVGFHTRYDNELVKIGGPAIENGYILKGEDSKGCIECELQIDKDNPHKLSYKYSRHIDRGTSLVFKPDFRNDQFFVQSPFLDNRLGIYAMLEVAKTIKNGAIAFSCWEEHGGGSVGFITKFLWEKYNIRQALIADITWITPGIKPGLGVVVSLRDQNIPRRSFVNRITDIADMHQVKYQLEVESSGSSDGGEIQKSPYPVDWCFIGAAEENVHSPYERVHKNDIGSMIELYEILFQYL